MEFMGNDGWLLRHEKSPNVNWQRVEEIFGPEENYLSQTPDRGANIKIQPPPSLGIVQVQIIGIGHKAGVGKQVAADYLTEKYGHFQLSFADPLRNAAQTLFGFSHYQMLDRALKEKPDPRWGISPRQALQQLGDALRGQFGADFLIRIMKNRVDAAAQEGAKAVVIPDVRFWDEVAAIQGWRGRLFRIDRDAPAVNAHKSEIQLDGFDGWDAILDNNGDFQHLYDQLDGLLGSN